MPMISCQTLICFIEDIEGAHEKVILPAIRPQPKLMNIKYHYFCEAVNKEEEPININHVTFKISLRD